MKKKSLRAIRLKRPKLYLISRKNRVNETKKTKSSRCRMDFNDRERKRITHCQSCANLIIPLRCPPKRDKNDLSSFRLISVRSLRGLQCQAAHCSLINLLFAFTLEINELARIYLKTNSSVFLINIRAIKSINFLVHLSLHKCEAGKYI